MSWRISWNRLENRLEYAESKGLFPQDRTNKVEIRRPYSGRDRLIRAACAHASASGEGVQ